MPEMFIHQHIFLATSKPLKEIKIAELQCLSSRLVEKLVLDEFVSTILSQRIFDIDPNKKMIDF